jgi:hypothetical protein
VEWYDYPLLAGVAFLSALLGSVAGTGGSLVLLPALVLHFGIQDATAILLIANAAANVSRVWVNRRELVLPVVWWFALGSVPLVVAGAWLFTIAAPELLTRVLGGFLLFMLLWRHMPIRPPKPPTVRWFFPVGLAIGFVSGLMASSGPLSAPFFLSYGLLRGAYIGTDALITVLMHIPKAAVFLHQGLISRHVLIASAVLIPFMIGGAVYGKRILDRVPDRVFAYAIEAVLLVAGVNFLLRG